MTDGPTLLAQERFGRGSAQTGLQGRRPGDLVDLHHAVEAAQVAVAVRMVAPEKYMAFHQAMLNSRGQADRAKALAVAKEVGIDPALIQKQATSPELNATLDESMKIAEALALNGTPSYVIGDQVVIGAVGFDKLKAAVAKK